MIKLLFLLAILAGCTPAFANPVEIADSYSYVREATNRNDAPEIDEFLAWAGLGPGYAWCQAFTNYCIDADATYRVMPQLAAGRLVAKHVSKHRLEFGVVSSRDVLMGADVPPGAGVAWKHGVGADVDTFNGNGHAGLVVYWSTDSGMTIEGNTTPSNLGDQRGENNPLTQGHDGVYYKERQLGINSSFPVVLFYWRLR